MKSRNDNKFYVGCYSENNGNIIYQIDISQAGTINNLVPLTEAYDGKNASYMQAIGDVLYTANENNPGSIIQFKIEKDNSLSKCLEAFTQNKTNTIELTNPVYIHESLSSSNLIIAAYGHAGEQFKSGLLAFDLNGNEGFHPTQMICYQGSSIDPERQNEPHAHGICSYFDGKTEFIFVADLGTDQIHVYEIAGNALLTCSVLKSKPGSGPRHLACYQKSRYVYVTNELSSSLSIYEFHAENKALIHINDIEIPQEGKERNYPSTLQFSPNGKYLYVANRGNNDISQYEVANGGKDLNKVSSVSPNGTFPRDIKIDKSGQFLIAANQTSHNISVFTIDPETGELFLSDQAPVRQPVCICFP